MFSCSVIYHTNRNIGIGVSFENKFYYSWILRIASIVNPAKTGDGNFFTLFKPRKIILKRDFCDSDGTLQLENFYWNLNFAISLMANSLNLNSLFHLLYFQESFNDICMYKLKFKNQNLLKFNCVNLTHLSQVAKFHSVYIFNPVG